MSKRTAIIVPDLAYTSTRGTRGKSASGYRELKAKLKYYEFRDDHDGHIPQEAGLERWHDLGLGQHYRAILKQCNALATDQVLAWTWVISPDPALLAMMPPDQRADFVANLTEQIVQQYYLARGLDVPPYAYVTHDRLTNSVNEAGAENEIRFHQVHTHVVLPAHAPTTEGSWMPFFNRARNGDLALLRDIATEQFELALDEQIGVSWRQQIEPADPDPAPSSLLADAEGLSELDRWFGRNRPTRELD